jgi:hypothetical protein
MTPAQHARTAQMLTEFAGEPVEVEQIKGTIYGFASELGCLRIFAKYNSNGAVHNKKIRVGFSSNLNRWFASLDLEYSP